MGESHPLLEREGTWGPAGEGSWGELGSRPVDIAIGDGKNVSVNVTALSVPFSHKGSSPQAADTLESTASAGQRHGIQLQHASAQRNTHTHTRTSTLEQPPFNPTSRSVRRKRTRGKRQSERAEMKVWVLSC